MTGPVVALAGGVGAARFLDGLARVMDPGRLCIVGNTADDTEMYGLHISPDLDTVAYTLAGLANPEHGWGLEGDTFHCLDALRSLGADAWFQLGDRDFATHLYRTARLRAGATLTQVTRELCASWGVRPALLPMSDDPVRTRVKTRHGTLDFQTYFVRRGARDTVLGIDFRGALQARPAPGLLQAIRNAARVILCPSNPIISIGPILAVPGIREALRKSAAPVVAISPIVGGKALKGPAARMMKSLGLRVSATGVAELYRDFLHAMLLDRADERLAPAIEKLGIRAVVTDTIMTGLARKKALARAALGPLRP
ncbi:MAG TPA: 2-phospho-L-lactate transferase [Bryobacteraceae bacterium]|nr:2-phospho-L-lactate transferase [Bryobacteraceae bacterium]